MREVDFRPLVLGLMACLATACASESGDTEMAGGQAIFQATCANCHGPQGLGDGPMASSLPTQPANLIEHLAHHTRAQLVQLVRAGIPPAMPPQALTEAQVLEVVDYIWTLVPADQVEAMREMQAAVERGDMPSMSGPASMGGMEGMDHSNMPGMSADSTGAMPMDHSQHQMPQGN
jgi:mono/diheme cytochrome c family protein